MVNLKKKSDNKIVSFSFGEPVPMSASAIFDFLEMNSFNGRYYEPPIDRDGLAKSFRISPHHSSAIFAKRNILTSLFVNHRLLSRAEFGKWVTDFLIFGDSFMENIVNRLGNPISLRNSLAKKTRVGKDDKFFFIESYSKIHEFNDNRIFHLIEPDINQEIYGAPTYLAGLQSAWLNESATLFRRRYFENGAHGGYIMYMSDAAADTDDISTLIDSIKKTKGTGNFKNMFLYAPNGKKDGLQIIPLSEVQAKDQFLNIKKITRDDILAAHRVPAQMLGVVPENTGGFGDVEKASRIFYLNEIFPLQQQLQALNDWLGVEVVKFNEYRILDEK